MNVQTDKKVLRILSKFGSKRSSLPRLYHHIQRIFSGKGGRRMDQDMYALMSYCGYMLSLKNQIGSKQSRARRVKIPILSRAPKPLFSCFGEGGISPFRLHGLNVNGPKPRRGANAPQSGHHPTSLSRYISWRNIGGMGRPRPMRSLPKGLYTISPLLAA